MGLDTFTTGLSGLNASSAGLDVVGNNLANLNTVGFKSSSASFADVLGQTFSTGSSGAGINLGMGVQVSGTTTDWSTGSIQSTSNPLDVAIQGQGFLMVNGANGTQYTRDGDLQLDGSNNLVNQSGLNVQGYVMDPATGQINQNLGLQNIQLPTGLTGATPTSQFQVNMNLDASAPAGTQFQTTVQVYDSLGTAHDATLTMEKGATAGTPPQTTWNYDVTIPQKDIAGAGNANSTAQYSLVTGATAGASPNAGGLVFDSNGNLTSAYVGSSAPSTLPALANLQIPPTGTSMPAMADGATLSPSMSWSLVAPSSTSSSSSSTASNPPSITGFDSTSTVTYSSQNGAAAGTLSSMSVQPDGTIAATFTNGKTVPFAQIALAQFSNVDGLTQDGGGLYNQSITSGAANVVTPGNSGTGKLVGGALEQSNVDLATELTNVITFQRSYQANAKVISTTDQIMQQTLQIMQ